MYIVKDYHNKIKIPCETREDVQSSFVFLCGLFRSDLKNVMVEDTKSGVELCANNF